MPRSLYIPLLLLIVLPRLFSQENNGLDVSLLTCSSGEALYSTFGHSAIRVTDHRSGRDLVFDYGVFDFDEPFFLWKFLKGNLKYKLGVRKFEDFLAGYQEEGRGVIEEELNLSEADEYRIYDLLIENYRPENRYYHYDFLYDNCSTRIRDLVEQIDPVEIRQTDATGNLTFRENLDAYLAHRKWLEFGIDLLLGARAGFWRLSLTEKLAPYFYAIIGAVGLLLLFMWAGTTHHSTKMNWNLLWANPLYILLMGSRGRKWGAYLLIVITTLSVLLVAGWVLMPQHLNVAVVPVIGVLLFLNVKSSGIQLLFSENE